MWLDNYHSNKLKVLVELSSVCNAACPQCDRFKPGTLDTYDFLERKIWSLADFIYQSHFRETHGGKLAWRI